tara:strand:+ start:268 stop:465 length:198 start_codon:yes stop_codon:yes gene_type:complete
MKFKYDLNDSNSKYNTDTAYTTAYYTKYAKGLQIAESLKIETNIFKIVFIGCYLVIKRILNKIKR